MPTHSILGLAISKELKLLKKASDAYEILIGRLKALAPDDRNSAKQRNQTSVTNAYVDTNTVVRTNVCPISFNTMPGKEYISAKETNPELQYRHGPIKINGEDSYWILTTVNNMCPDGNMIAEDVRLSMKIRRISETEVTLKIICQVAKPQVSEHTIKFVSERPFELVYFNGSPYLYSEYY